MCHKDLHLRNDERKEPNQQQQIQPVVRHPPGKVVGPAGANAPQLREEHQKAKILQLPNEKLGARRAQRREARLEKFVGLVRQQVARSAEHAVYQATVQLQGGRLEQRI